MQHIEEAGVHSGDSSCVLPSYLISEDALATMREYTRQLALALKVRGLVNVQYAIKDGKVYVLEVNPRAARTIPFVSKATGIPMAKVAAKLMIGKTLAELGLTEEPAVSGYAVKESVFPFKKFAGVDPLLGPEMRSTGEVMGIGKTFGEAFAKGQQGTGFSVPIRGTVFVTVHDSDKATVLPIIQHLSTLGFRIIATGGTAEFLALHDIPLRTIYKISEGRPNVLDMIKNGEIDIVINTPLGREGFRDEMAMRRECYSHNILLLTTMSAARATVEAVKAQRENSLMPVALQDLHQPLLARRSALNIGKRSGN
jgi:carbamoyl-phosphate synthase large subunit